VIALDTAFTDQISRGDAGSAAVALTRFAVAAVGMVARAQLLAPHAPRRCGGGGRPAWCGDPPTP
jgi:hypothetical protein